MYAYTNSDLQNTHYYKVLIKVATTLILFLLVLVQVKDKTPIKHSDGT